MKHKKLTKTERELLSQWKNEGLSNIECAKRLGCDKSTIGRELIRNRIRVTVGKNDWKVIYEPLHAHSMALDRKQKAFTVKHPLKNPDIYSYVLDHLRGGWSPEQISGRLKEEDHKGEPHWQICMETIYQFIYKEKTDLTKQGLKQNRILDKRLADGKSSTTITDKDRPLWEFLRRKQVRRRKKGGRKSQRVRIPDRVSIHDRPAVVAKRKQFGHWEGDSIVGKSHVSGLHTEYERVASLTRFERLERITADEIVVAAKKIFDPLPSHARRSTTLDKGSEHVDHKEFGVQIYFADPYSSWQRGGNENCNMWIRYYFPKGTDFSTITDEELRDVEWELNNRPRKRLNYKTPQEVFDCYLKRP
ncbi:IS30 family transposase [Candidatus Parcubacteria bacterium]|nr:MAG: IS30 family transposase [Candidatus Parcubacteria bacterium]